MNEPIDARDFRRDEQTRDIFSHRDTCEYCGEITPRHAEDCKAWRKEG